MLWFRIDNRLVHGQVIESWLPYTDADYLLVANDILAEDCLQQAIIMLAVPSRVHVHFIRLDRLAAAIEACGEKNVFVLVANCADAISLHNMGVVMDDVNVGNLHYGPGKRLLLPHVAVSEEDVDCLRQLVRCNVRLDFRCTPGETEPLSHDCLA